MAGPAEAGATVLFINQVRKNINTGPFGPSNTTPGGLALRFYSSVRMEIRRIGSIEQSSSDKTKTGNQTRVKVVKNKVAPPFREAEFDIIYGKGIHRPREVLQLAIEHGLAEKKGSWIAIDGQNVAQGENKAVEYLEEHADVLARLEEGVRGADAPPCRDCSRSRTAGIVAIPTAWPSQGAVAGTE